MTIYGARADNNEGLAGLSHNFRSGTEDLVKSQRCSAIANDTILNSFKCSMLQSQMCGLSVFVGCMQEISAYLDR